MPPPITPGATSGHLLGDLWQDLRYGARTLRRTPLFTLAVLWTLTRLTPNPTADPGIALVGEPRDDVGL